MKNLKSLGNSTLIMLGGFLGSVLGSRLFSYFVRQIIELTDENNNKFLK